MAIDAQSEVGDPTAPSGFDVRAELELIRARPAWSVGRAHRRVAGRHSPG